VRPFEIVVLPVINPEKRHGKIIVIRRGGQAGCRDLVLVRVRGAGELTADDAFRF
jgi:hypothetical protein